MKFAGKDFFTNSTYTVPSGVTTLFIQPIPNQDNSTWGLGTDAVVAIANISTDGKSHLQPVAWGRNQVGQLGDGTLDNRSIPTQMAGIDVATYRDVYKVQMADSNAVLTTARSPKFYSTGPTGLSNWNLDGGPATSSPVAMSVTTSAIGMYRTEGTGFILNSDGTLIGWGNNAAGQLANNTLTDQTSPVQVVGSLKFTQVFQASNSIYARTTDNEIWCWGDNNYFKLGLGNGSNATYSTPILFSSAANNGWKKFVGNFESTIGLKYDGTVWVWGSNNVAVAYANPNPALEVSVPALMPGLPYIKDIDSSNLSAISVIALAADGRLYTWGENHGGQLGLNNQVAQSIPQLVVSDPTIVGVRMGERISGYMTASGDIRMAGQNFSGQMGNNSSGAAGNLVHLPVVRQINVGGRTVPISFVSQVGHPAPPVAVTVTPGQAIQVNPGTTSIVVSGTTYTANAGLAGIGLRVFWYD